VAKSPSPISTLLTESQGSWLHTPFTERKSIPAKKMTSYFSAS